MDIKRHLSNCKVKLAINATVGVVVIILFVIGLYAVYFLSQQHSEEYHAKQEELREIEIKLKATQEDIVRLQREKERMSTPQGVEDAARSRLGMVRPGEVVYVVDSAALKEAAITTEEPQDVSKEKQGSSTFFRILGNILY